jgi:hypothetical protein
MAKGMGIQPPGIDLGVIWRSWRDIVPPDMHLTPVAMAQVLPRLEERFEQVLQEKQQWFDSRTKELEAAFKSRQLTAEAFEALLEEREDNTVEIAGMRSVVGMLRYLYSRTVDAKDEQEREVGRLVEAFAGHYIDSVEQLRQRMWSDWSRMGEGQMRGEASWEEWLQSVAVGPHAKAFADAVLKAMRSGADKHLVHEVGDEHWRAMEAVRSAYSSYHNNLPHVLTDVDRDALMVRARNAYDAVFRYRLDLMGGDSDQLWRQWCAEMGVDAPQRVLEIMHQLSDAALDVGRELVEKIGYVQQQEEKIPAIEWDEAVNLIRGMGGKLGEPIASKLNEMLDSGRIHALKHELSPKGALHFRCYSAEERRMLNFVHAPFDGSVSSLDSLVHELGHAVATLLNSKHGMVNNESYAIAFEALLAKHMEEEWGAEHPAVRQQWIYARQGQLNMAAHACYGLFEYDLNEWLAQHGNTQALTVEVLRDLYKPQTTRMAGFKRAENAEEYSRAWKNNQDAWAVFHSNWLVKPYYCVAYLLANHAVAGMQLPDSPRAWQDMGSLLAKAMDGGVNTMHDSVRAALGAGSLDEPSSMLMTDLLRQELKALYRLTKGYLPKAQSPQDAGALSQVCKESQVAGRDDERVAA